MSDSKKYYYLKLKDNFFEGDTIMILENMPDGYLYSNILLKLYLKSLKNDGYLMVNEFIPYDENMIASLTRHPVGVVQKAVNIFKNLGLVDIVDNGVIYMSDIQLFIGKSSTEAERKKQERMKALGQMSDIRPPEIRDKSIDSNNKVPKNNEVVEEIEGEQPQKNEKAPTIITTINSFTDNTELRQSIKDYLIMRKKIKKPVTTVRTIQERLNELKSLSDIVDIQIQIVNQSVDNCWQKFYELKNQSQTLKKQHIPKIEDLLPEGYDYLPKDVQKDTYEHYQQVIQKGIEDGTYE